MINHRWDITPSQAIRLQRDLAGQLRFTPLAGPVRIVAGTDCAFVSGGREIVTAAVLCDARKWKVLAVATDRRPCTFPYVPGLLSFREAPSVIAAVKALPQQPDLIICDGQGYAHPRRLGLASHIGLLLGIPTIGAAKSRLCGEAREPGMRRGCRVQLRHNGEVVGLVVRTRDNVKPIYVSPGHLITLKEAVAWALRSAVSARLCRPVALAHQHVTLLSRQG